MKAYNIEISHVDLSPRQKYVVAQDFEEAYQKALKIHAKYRKEGFPDAEITRIQLEFELEKET